MQLQQTNSGAVIYKFECESGHDPQELDQIMWKCQQFTHQEPKARVLEKLIKMRHLPPYDINVFFYKPDVEVMLLAAGYFKLLLII